MNRRTRLRGGAVLCAGCLLHACASAPQPAATQVFLVAAPQDLSAVQAMAREQQRHSQTCAATRSCDRVHYVRALAALYEDRAAAEKHFRAVVADAPNGRYAASSRHWLRLLEESSNGSSRDPRLMQTVDRLVREVLEHEATAQRAAMRPPEPKAAEIPIVQSLKQQLKAQEKRIEELTEQIDALKRVDQEVKEQVKPSRPVP
jgi:TolA-binding protein